MFNYITWTANPILIDSFIDIRWYSLMFLIGFLVGYKIVEKMFRREGAYESWLSTLLMYVVFATIIGARLGHVFFYEWDQYSQNPNFKAIKIAQTQNCVRENITNIDIFKLTKEDNSFLEKLKETSKCGKAAWQAMVGR